jgi:osmotically-inducible protein OsmY
MKRFLLTFSLGVLTGGGLVFYIWQPTGRGTLEQAQAELAQGAAAVRSKVQNTFSNLSAEAIREELTASGLVVREKARKIGQAILDATANARITATIKAKLLAEPNLPGMRINVDTAGGLVTLSGTADTPDQIARAIRLALETDGVTKVVSTIQLHPNNPPAK